MFVVLKKEIINSLLAGVLISIGGTAFLSCQEKVVGAFLFSVALIFICAESLSLYTGKICYFPEKINKKFFFELLCCLLGNIFSTYLCALFLKLNHSNLRTAADLACNLKLNKSPLQIFTDAFFCGILIYLAVNFYKKNKSIFGILVCIPVFILCGFEHCIADVFYFYLSSINDMVRIFSFILIAVIGNSAGGMLIPFFKKIAGK